MINVFLAICIIGAIVTGISIYRNIKKKNKKLS